MFQNIHVSFTPLLIILLVSVAWKDSQLFSHLSLYQCRRFNNQSEFFFCYCFGFLLFNFLLEARFTSRRCLTLPAVIQSVLTPGPRWQVPARTPQDDTNARSETNRWGQPGGDGPMWWRRVADSVGPWLNDLRQAASPREAKRPSVILSAPASSAPVFDSLLARLFFLFFRHVFSADKSAVGDNLKMSNTDKWVELMGWVKGTRWSNYTISLVRLYITRLIVFFFNVCVFELQQYNMNKMCITHFLTQDRYFLESLGL